MALALNHLGQFTDVDDDLMGIVSEIRDRWPDLNVRYTESKTISDSPYVIVDNQDRIVLQVWQLDRRVIDQLSLRDKSKRELLALFEAEERKAQRAKEYKEEQERGEIKDKLTSVFKSPKGVYTVPDQNGKIVKIEDG